MLKITWFNSKLSKQSLIYVQNQWRKQLKLELPDLLRDFQKTGVVETGEKPLTILLPTCCCCLLLLSSIFSLKIITEIKITNSETHPTIYLSVSTIFVSFITSITHTHTHTHGRQRLCFLFLLFLYFFL